MDDESYEQIKLQKGWVGKDRIPYLQEGMKVVIESHEERPVGLELPEQVVLEVVETEPTVKGQAALRHSRAMRTEKRLKQPAPWRASGQLAPGSEPRPILFPFAAAPGPPTGNNSAG